MRVAIDGGALCAIPGKQFGTFRFSSELFKALSLYGTHDYTVYSFCDIDTKKKEKNIRYKTVKPSFGWMKLRLPYELAKDKPEIFLGTNQVFPFGFSGKKIAFSHGLSFYCYPEYYASEYSRLSNQLKNYTQQADHIIVSSEQVKTELITIFPESARKIIALPFGLFDTEKKPERSPKPYFLYVGSDQQIKNVSGLIYTFTEFWKRNRTLRFKLILVGTERKDLPPYIEQIGFADYQQLQKLYAEASAYVSCSYYESFNYPVIEALQAGCPVVALDSAIIPEQLPFVQTAEHIDDLLFLFEKAAQGNFEFKETPKVAEIFNWELYVKQLERLYRRPSLINSI
jgi:glycosyltransferase involved in cell wall biosynthesis